MSALDHHLLAVRSKLQDIVWMAIRYGPNTQFLTSAARELITICEEAAWQPIDSAPRDGTLLVWRTADKNNHAVIYWPCYKECFHDEGSMWKPLYPRQSIFTD